MRSYIMKVQSLFAIELQMMDELAKTQMLGMDITPML
jgi:hypothetical protein